MPIIDTTKYPGVRAVLTDSDGTILLGENPALVSIDSQKPKQSVALVDGAGAALTEKVFDFGSAGTNPALKFLLIFVEDLVSASQIARDGGPGAVVLLPRDTRLILLGDALVKCYLVGIGVTTSAVDNIIGYAETNIQTIRSALIELNAAVAQNVLAIRVSTTDVFTAVNDFVIINLDGASNAS